MSAKNTLPFQERNTLWRGPLDLITGRYPRFLFGGAVGSSLPVFHFHEIHPEQLEPYFAYLVENGYHTVTTHDIDLYIRGEKLPGKKAVAISFDDAWSSFWLAAYPLLNKYQLRATLFVSPGRITSDHAPRPHTDGMYDGLTDRQDPMFCSWPELTALHKSGLVDIQAHGNMHAKIACHPDPLGFIRASDRFHPHEIPMVDALNGPRLASRADAGAPLFPARSRLSDALRWSCPEATEACREMAATLKNADANKHPDWFDILSSTYCKAPRGRFETPEERNRAILEELVLARQHLEERIGKTINHMCFPWAIAGRAARRIAAEAGYRSAFSDRLAGYRSVQTGDSPYQLMRLKHEYIFCLPGKSRTWFFGKKPAPAHRGLNLENPLLPVKATK